MSLPPEGRLIVAGHIVSCQQVRLEKVWDEIGAYIGWQYHMKATHEIIVSCLNDVGTFYTWVSARGFYMYRGDVRIVEIESIWDEMGAHSVTLLGIGKLEETA